MKVYLFFSWTRGHLNRLASAMAEGLRMVVHSGTSPRTDPEALTPMPVPVAVEVPRTRITRRWRA